MSVIATYRLQLHAGFRFDDARAIVDYLADLGVSHVYVSPYLAARKGSTHGYDLVDPTRLNPEIGDAAAYAAWTSALARRGMGHVVDVVPNHMAASTENAWWSDVLENGAASVYADHFDVEWHPQKEALAGKILLPVLGAQYGEVLERGELRLERRGGAFFVRYWDRALPVDPRTLAPVLERVAARSSMPAGEPRRQELESIVTALKNLPPVTETADDKRHERAREKEVIKRRLAAVAADDGEIARGIDAELARINGTPGEVTSFEELDRLLVDQPYRLAYWRVATEEINYRRFFDINELAAVRMERDAVFADVHELLLRLVGEGHVEGVRLDHTDGLYDPAAYFAKLRRAIRARAGEAADVYVVAEKILSKGEELPEDWEVDGTTGYDFLAQATGVLVDPRGEEALTRLYQEMTGDPRSFAEHARDAKRAVMRSSLSSEVHMLSRALERIAMRDRRSRDFTLPMLHRAVSETIAAFPVYRTYVRPDGTRTERDEAIVTRAIRLAKRRNPEVSPSAFDFLRNVLLFAWDPIKDDPRDRAARAELAMRFQQLTGPVTAKGVEDAAFYTYVRFVALNEVGGSPDAFGTTTAELHAANAARQRRWPRAMTTTSTHDTKRGEDVRARLAVLSEMPETWTAWVREWSGMTAAYVRTVDDEPAPSAADRYLFYQTALGAHPLASAADASFTDRLVAYAVKAAREAKQRTSWLSANEAYEEALRAFVVDVMADGAFRGSLARASEQIATYGASNGLAQVVLSIASPGVPDRYQGSESWDLRLVDPDNRAPVDHAALAAALAETEHASAAELVRSFRDGRVKLLVVRRALAARRAMPRTFVGGEYRPIDAGDEIVAFERRGDDGRAIALVARFPLRVTEGRSPWPCGAAWRERSVGVPAGRWRDALSRREHVVGASGARAADLFADLPVALLVAV